VRRQALLAAIAAAGCSAGCSKAPAGRTVRVAAASDLASAFEELGPAFAASTHVTPVVELGASGLLAKRIAEGAPIALFAAANRSYVDEAIASGRCDAATARSYARGQLVAWTTGAPLATLADLAHVKHLAIANPEHAPYGRAAQQALERAHLWDALGDRVVLAESVQAALQYARTGAVDAALVSRSLVPAEGATLVIDPALYDPLDQVLVVCGSGAEAADARALAEFITSPDGRAILARHHLAPPPP
jgi:molybdate transport system substrate-binding protein